MRDAEASAQGSWHYLCVTRGAALGGFGFAFDGLQFRTVDGDPTRLLLVGNDALQIDMKQAVFEFRGADFDMLGKLEAAVEGPTGNALIQVVMFRGVFASARDGQHAITQLDIQILLAEASNSKRDPVACLVGAFDVVGRKAVA